MPASPRCVSAGDHVFLVDGSLFVFRAYFQSIRQDQKYNYRSDRLHTGAAPVRQRAPAVHQGRRRRHH